MILGVGLTHQCPALNLELEQPLELAHQIKRDLTSHFSWHLALLGLDLNQLQNIRNKRRLEGSQFSLTSTKSTPKILALHMQFSAECKYSALRQALSLPLPEIAGCTETSCKYGGPLQPKSGSKCYFC